MKKYDLKKALLILCILFAGFLKSNSQSVIISQYIETNSGTTPKGIEIFNISGSAIDFSVTNLQIYQGTNGAACAALAGTLITSGTLAANEVWVIGTSDLTAYAIANGSNLSGTTTFSFAFNGDDALQLYLGGVLQDQFGICGSDPGTSWTGSGVNTANQNISTKSGICTGDTDGWTDPSLRFETTSTDPYSGGGTAGMVGFGNAPAGCSGCTIPTNATALTSTASCLGITVSWTAPTCQDEVLVVVHANTAVTATPSGDGSAYTANAAYGSGTDLGSSNYAVYKGSGTSVLVTGLTASTTYHYEVFTRKGTTWSSGVVTNATASVVPNATALTSTVSCSGISVSWTAPTCQDEVLVVVHPNTAVTGTPSGDGSIYTANNIYGLGTDLGSSNYVVYKGSGTSVLVTGLTASTTYHFEVFTRKGTSWSSGVVTNATTPSGVTSGPTTFNPGELTFIAYDSYLTTGEDKWAILTLVNIGAGTEFIIGNALYDWNAPAGVLSNKWYPCASSFTAYPEFMEFTYTGCTDIPAGSVICISTTTGGMIFGDIYVNGVAATSDFAWTGDAGNMSTSAPDAMWLMQGTLGGDLTEPDGPDADGAIDHYTTFDGNVLGAVQTLGNFQDPALAGNAGGSRVSRYHPQVACLYINAGVGGSRFYGYHNGITSGTFYALLSDITNVSSNWVISTTDGGDDIAASCGITYTLTGLAGRSGRWRGGVSTDWFDCHNWENFAVPHKDLNVVVNSTATRDCDISYTSPFSYIYNYVAECDSLNITARSLTIDTLGDSLNVYGRLSVRVSGVLNMDDGNAALGGYIRLKGDWENTVGTASFLENTGIVNFNGSSDQTIRNTYMEEFSNIDIIKPSGHVYLTNDISIDNELYLEKGNINTSTFKTTILNTASTAISLYSSNSFVNGNLRRYVALGNTYAFPLGYSNTTTDYHPAEIINTDMSGVTYVDGYVTSITEAGNDVDIRLIPIQTGIGKLNNIKENAIWDFIPNSQPSSGTYGVNLYVTNIAGLIDDQFVPAKRASSSTDYADWDIFETTTTIPSAGLPGRITSGGTGYAQRLGYTSFSQHAISALDTSVIVPISFINLSSQYFSSDNKVLLDWKTISRDVSIGYFEILRSSNGIDYQIIDQVPYQDEFNRYNYIDYNVQKGKYFYKIKFVSTIDQKQVLSNINLININEDFTLSVYPNPANDVVNIFISGQDEQVEYAIYNAVGELIMTETLNTSRNEPIHIHDLPKGIYVIQAQSTTQKIVEKLIVQ